MNETYIDTLYLNPGRSISEYLDPGLSEACHRPAASPPPPFLATGPSGITPRPAEADLFHGEWVFWFILAGFAILTIARYYYLKRLKLLFASILKRSASLQLIRESPVHAHQSFLPFLAIYTITSLLLIHHVIGVFSPGAYGGIGAMAGYAELFGLYLGFFALKIIAIFLISILFRNVETGVEYIQNILMFNLVLGIILLPVLLLVTFISREIFVYIAVALAVLMMALRFIRGIVIGLSDTKFSLFHLFLYLCTLEILPVMIAAIFISKYFL